MNMQVRPGPGEGEVQVRIVTKSGLYQRTCQASIEPKLSQPRGAASSYPQQMDTSRTCGADAASDY